MKIPIDEAFAQYILDAASSVDDLVMKRFSESDRKILLNVHSASLEEALHILGLLGKRYAIVVGDRKKIIENKINVKAILRWFRNKTLKHISPALRDWGLFIRADKEIVQSLSLLSLEINPKTMFQLRNYEEIALHASNVSDVYVRAQVTKQSQLIVDEFLTQAFAMYYRVKFRHEAARLKIKADMLPILFYFSANREHKISAIMIAQWLSMHEETSKMRAKLEQMVNDGHLQKHVVGQEGEYYYQLTGFGVHTVNKIRDSITYKT